MGSEIIIPGTPIGDIPPYDRPNFDPRKQNGFVGSLANLAAPPPGSSVARLSFVQSFTGLNPERTNTQESGGWVQSVAAGSNQQALAPVAGTSFGGQNINGWWDVLLFAPGVAAGLVFVQDGASNNNIIDIGAAGAAGVLLRGVNPAYIKLSNTDAGAHNVNVFIMQPPDLQEFATIGNPTPPVLTLSGINLAPTDVLRLRRVWVSAVVTGAVPDFELALVQIALLKSAAQNPYTAQDVFDLDTPSQRVSNQPLLGGVDPTLYASRRTPIDILGTDFNAAGAVYTPSLAVLAYSRYPRRNAQTVNLSVGVLADWYQGANQ